MTDQEFDDETLMRFADGELDDETSASLAEAMETDEALAARVALFVETRVAAQTALKPLLDEPVPGDLAASVERMIAERQAAAAGQPTRDAAVLPFPPRSPARMGARRFALPLAASIAAVLGGLGGYLLATQGGPADGALDIAGLGNPALGATLLTAASGEALDLPESNERFRAIATFRDSAQVLCREFEVDTAGGDTVISVACLSGQEWTLRFAVASPAGDSGYAPASSTAALDAYLAAIEAAAPMGAAEETEALRQARERIGQQSR